MPEPENKTENKPSKMQQLILAAAGADKVLTQKEIEESKKLTLSRINKAASPAEAEKILEEAKAFANAVELVQKISKNGKKTQAITLKDVIQTENTVFLNAAQIDDAVNELKNIIAESLPPEEKNNSLYLDAITESIRDSVNKVDNNPSDGKITARERFEFEATSSQEEVPFSTDAKSIRAKIEEKQKQK